jgi:uncharacterized membrane protein YadS
MITKILKNIFATWIGWLAITIVIAICTGVNAAHSIDEKSKYWSNAFWVSILLPIGLIFFQLLWPFLLKLKARALCIIPLIILTAWIVKRDSIINQSPEYVWWLVIAFLLTSFGLILEQPSTDNIGRNKK